MFNRARLKLFLLSIMCLTCFSCQTTGYFIQDSNLPASDTRKIASSVFGKPRFISPNGRELSSVYHNEKFEAIEEPDGAPERFFTKTSILGAKRPFEIQVQVIWERYELETDAFVHSGVNEDLSFRRANTLRKALKEAVEAGIKLDGDIPF